MAKEQVKGSIEVLHKIEERYNREVAWELYYLYLETGDKFWGLVNKLPLTTDANIMREYVKALIHSIEIKWFSGITDARKVTEIRKALEDIKVQLGVDTRAYKSCALAMQMVALDTLSNPQCLYEARRLFDLKAYDTFINVCNNMTEYRVYDWRVVDIIYRMSKKHYVFPYTIEILMRDIVRARAIGEDACDEYITKLL